MKKLIIALLSVLLISCSGNSSPEFVSKLKCPYDIVLLGDSTFNQFGDRLKGLTCGNVTNYGLDAQNSGHLISGEYSKVGKYSDFITTVPKGSLVIVNFGINDAFAQLSPTDFKNNINYFGDLATKNGLIFAIQTPNEVLIPTNEVLSRYVALEKTLGYPIIDIFYDIKTNLRIEYKPIIKSRFPGLSEHELNVKINQVVDDYYREQLKNDGFHPTSEIYDKWVKVIIDSIGKI